jgi:hypothetical protein
MDFSQEKKKPLFISRKGDKVKFSSINDVALKENLASLYSYLSQHLGIKEVPKLTLTTDRENADNPFGMTGHYDHTKKQIRVYVTDRHDTDILRSFAHEIIHHWQNERGTLHPEEHGGDELPIEHDTSPHYAQHDPHLRKREMEAYLFGNILFRDWQDENRMGPPKVQPFLPQPLNENLQVDPTTLRQEVVNFVKSLVATGVLTSFHRERTSGDMDPKDFVGDLVHDLLSSIERWVQNVNNRGNQENQPNMIKEVICMGCSEVCDYGCLPEIKMGYVKCPGCNKTMDQEGNVYE